MSRRTGRSGFRYLEEWVELVGAPVATSLPVASDRVVRPGGPLPSYFAGLLPEGRRLGVLRRAVKTSPPPPTARGVSGPSVGVMLV